MANRNLFSTVGAFVPDADACNNAGGRAYALSPKAALAQMAVTGVFEDTFYVDAKTQLAKAKGLASQVDPKFLAQLAVYARRDAFMKDMPAYLAAVLASRDVSLLSRIFDRVIDNGKMLRNFVQMIRSGEAGRRSLGTRPKKLVAGWLNNAKDGQLLSASVGTSPSLGDVIRLSHAAAGDTKRNAFFKYVLGREYVFDELPEQVQALEFFRSGLVKDLPKVPFELLTSMNLSEKDWKDIARNATWNQTRMNLNTFLRHGVFRSPEMVALVAERLADPEQVARENVFPYQLLAAFLNVDAAMPRAVTNALQDAMEVAISNVPKFGVETEVLVDVSGSMLDPITGRRTGSASKVRCVDVAALFAASVLRKNPTAGVLLFNTAVLDMNVNPRDSIMTNAQKLAGQAKGGTDCSCSLRELNRRGAKANLVILVSDNESWADPRGPRASKATAVMEEWKQYKRRNPRAKLVCLDITPDTTSQAKEQRDVLNIGGFSDSVFKTIGLFAAGELSADHWVGEIEKVAV